MTFFIVKIIIALVFVLVGIDGVKYFIEEKIYWTKVKSGVTPKELVVRLRFLNRISGIGYTMVAIGLFSMFLGILVIVNK